MIFAAPGEVKQHLLFTFLSSNRREHLILLFESNGLLLLTATGFQIYAHFSQSFSLSSFVTRNINVHSELTMVNDHGIIQKLFLKPNHIVFLKSIVREKHLLPVDFQKWVWIKIREKLYLDKAIAVFYPFICSLQIFWEDSTYILYRLKESLKTKVLQFLRFYGDYLSIIARAYQNMTRKVSMFKGCCCCSWNSRVVHEIRGNHFSLSTKLVETIAVCPRNSGF